MVSRATRLTGPRVPERVVQQQIVTLLRSVGAAVYVLGTVRRRGDFHGTMQTPGLPDLFAVLPASKVAAPDGAFSSPTALWVEVKAEGGQLRREQAEFRAQCESAELAHVVGGVDDVIAWLIAGGWLKAENVPHYRRPA